MTTVTNAAGGSVGELPADAVPAGAGAVANPSGSARAGGAADDADLAAYLREASDWDRDRIARWQQSARHAWRVAAGAGSGALCCALALVLLLPLKRVEPFVIRVDDTTGVVDVVPPYAGRLSVPDSVTRYFLTHYVQTCQRFNYATAESDYEECGAFQTAQRNQAWYAQWSRSNPRSPLNMHRDGSQVSVQIESVSFFRRASGMQDLAQVRYLKIERAASGAQQQITHWIATLQYAYAAPSQDPRVRRWNPLGFKVAEFIPEPEVLREPPVADGAAAGRPQP
jgi:type IV secretion system protein VirB8